MAGRRRLRAPSNSTVATVDEQTIIYTKESEIIRAPPPGTKQDDWPCILLTEASVYNRHGQLANLLHVDLEGPFMIRGLMVVEPDQGSCLIRGHQRTRTKWIEIPRTYTYSIGLKEQSEHPVIWAAGESAHFELVPSERYVPIANIMFQGIIMHYRIIDIYEEELEAMIAREQRSSKQKKRKLRIQDVKFSLQDILYKYAASVGDGSTVEEVMERCKDQAGFLLTQFPKETGFYNWLSSECPDLVQRLKKKPNPSATVVFTEPEIPAPKSASTRQNSSSEETRGSKEAAKIKEKSHISKSSRASSKGQIDPVESGSDDQRGSRSRSAKTQRQPPRKSKMREASELVDVNMQDFAHKPMVLPARAKNGIPANASSGRQSALLALIDVLDEEREKLLHGWNTGAKQKKHPDTVPANGWLTKLYMAMSIPSYNAKSETLQYHAAGLAENLGPEWHDSELYKWAKQNANSKLKYEHITEEQILRIQRRQKNPNARSQGDKTTKAPGDTSGKRPPKGRTSGKAAGLRPSLGSKKRPRDELDDGDSMDVDDDDIPHKKTAKISQYFSNGEDEEEVESSASSDEEEQDSTTSEPLTRVVVHAEPLPSTQPKGPDQTWLCEEPNCGYIVRGANDEDGKEQIRQHYEDHEQEASDEAKERELNKVNHALQESRGLLPINYLLDKIRKANSDTNKAKPVELNGRVVPQPIKKSLLI